MPPKTPAAPVTPTVPTTPVEPVIPVTPVTPAESVTPVTPAESVVAEELPRKLNVIHKASGQKFEVSKDYYMRNKAAFELCR